MSRAAGRQWSRPESVRATQPRREPAQVHVQASEEDGTGHKDQLYVPHGDEGGGDVAFAGVVSPET
ncbi:hypothetical protein Misp01_39070 [Microtetraspora sp. NBRC 13810]|nr:hypothetical protein Misp01_39070 [Microtetraspora sp. NBRC 13810]